MAMGIRKLMVIVMITLPQYHLMLLKFVVTVSIKTVMAAMCLVAMFLELIH